MPFWELLFKILRVFFLGSDDFPLAALAAEARESNAALEAGWPGFEIGGSPGRRTPRRTTAPKGGGKVGRRGPLAAGTLPEHHPGQPVHAERGRHVLKFENP